MNKQERNIYFKLDEIDHQFTAFIVSESVPEVAKKKLEEEWIKHTAKNKVKIDAVWRKNI